MIARPPVRDVLARIAQMPPEALPPDADVRARAALAALEGQRTPWYLRLLVGIGAWVGAGFLLSFVLGTIALALGGESNSVAVGLGVVTVAGAIVLRRRVTGVFGSQIALVCAFAGQILFIGGVGSSVDSVSAGAIAAIFVSAVLIAFFPDRVQRFCSVVVVAGALFSLIVVEWRAPYGADAIALTLAALPIVLWRLAPRAAMEEASEIIEPVVYGLVVALFAGLVADAFLRSFIGFRPNEWSQVGMPTTIGFAVMTIWLVAAVAADHDVPWHKPEAVLVELGLILFGALTWRTPAIMATLLMLVLAFDRRARSLVALATLFFLGFGGLYYYDLHLTLLQKSGILMLSGALCLAGAAFVRWRFPQEVA